MRYHSLFLVSFLLLLHPIVTISTRFNSHEHRQLCRLGVDEFAAAQRAASRPPQPCSVLLTPPPTTRKTHRVMLKRLECVKSTSGGGPDVLNADDIVLRVLVDSQRTEQTWEHDFVGGHVFNFGRPTFDFARKVTFSVVEDDAGEDLDDMVGLFSVSTFSKPGDLVFESQRQGGHYRLHVRVQDLARGSNQIKYKGRLVSVKVKSTTGFGRDDVLLKLHADGEFVKSYSKTMGKGSQWDVDEEWFDVFDDLYFELFEDDILYDDRLGDDELVVPADKQAVERTFVVNGDGGTFEVTLALMPADELRMETGVDAKYEVQLMSVSCTKDQEWDDEPELSIFLDGATRAAKVWKWNDIDDGWHLDFVGQKFEFAHKIKLVMYELDFGRDAMDADDKLGESTIEPSGGGAHERTLHFKQEGAHYTVKLKYHSLTQPSRTAVLKSLKCVTENENWDDEPELIVATDGAEQLKKSWSGVDAGESVTVPRTRFEFREYLDLTMYELDGGRDAMDRDDKLGSSRIKITDSLGRHTVEFTQSGAKYVLTLDISTTPHGSSLVETEADAEADAMTSAFTALARYGGEEYGHNIYFDDICALAGDFFVSAVDRGISDSSISVNVAESGRHRTPAEALSLFDSVFRHWTKWVKTPEGAEHVGLYLNMFDKEESSILANAAPNRILYAYLEQELDCTTIECVTSSHDINLGRISMGDMPDLAYVSTTDLYWLHTISDSPFIVAASFNFDHFRDPGDREQGSVLAFKAGIRAAIAYAFENKKGGTGDTCSPDDAKNLAGALARAAHAAHFASDAFAPGHIRNPRRRMYNDLFDHCDGTILSGAEAVGVLAKLMHDEDNIFGVPVKSRDGKRSWTAYGDKSWNYEDNGENRAQAAAMIKFLISAVVDTFEGRCTSKDACEAHALKAVDMLPEVDEEQAYPPLWRWREPNGDQEGAWEYRSSAPDAPGAPDYTTDWGCGAINAIGNSLRSHKKDHEDRNSEEREDQSNPRFRALATPSRGNFGSGASGTVTSMQPPPQTEPGEGSQQAVSSTSTDPAPEEGSQLAAIGRAVSDALDVAAEAVHGLLQRMANREKEVVHIRFKEMDLNNDDRVHLDEFALWVHLKASNTRGVPASLQHLFAAKLFGQLLKTAGSSETFLRESDLEHSFQVLPHVGAGKPVTVSLVRLATRELRRMLALYSKGIRDAVIKGANGEVTLAEATQLFWKIFDDSWVLVDTPAALDISELGKSAAVLRDAEDAQAFVSKTKGAASSQSQTKLTVSVAASTASLATEAGIIESRGALHVRQRMFAKDPTAWNEALERIRAVVTPAAVLSTMDPKSGSDSPLRRFVSETARRKVEQELAPKLLNAWVEGLRKADAEVKKENAIPLAAVAGVAAGAIQPAPQPEATPESTKPSKAKVNKIIRRMEGNLQEALDGFSALTPELSHEPQFNALFSPTTSGKSS